MGPLELLAIAIGLSMDAFAVAVCMGLTINNATIKSALTAGLYFGVFQGIMPLIGFGLAVRFADKIVAVDHWIAFVLLNFIGAKMIGASFEKRGCSDRACSNSPCTDRQCPLSRADEKTALTPAKMVPLAVATSIDALAVGVSFAFLQVDITSAVFSIGITTFLLSAAGVKIGSVFGDKLKSRAELAGGVILVLMGFKILISHIQ